MATYTSQYPPAHSDTYVKSTNYYTNSEPFKATDPAQNHTVGWLGNDWVCYPQNSNQRFHIDLGSAKIIKRIFLWNQHENQSNVNHSGVKNFTFWGSNEATAFSELTYGIDTNWTQLTTVPTIWAEYTDGQPPVDQYALVTNTTAYRYYAFKFPDNYGRFDTISASRIELQTEDGGGASDVLSIDYIGGAASGMSVYTGGATAPIGYTSVVPTLDTNHVKVTSSYPSGQFQGWRSCDSSTSLTGEWDGQCWVGGASTNQRFHMDLGSSKVIKRIYYENGHWFGQNTSSVKNFTLWGSNEASAFNELTYGVDTNWTQITTAQSSFDQHVAADTPDPKYILVTNDTAYQYYAIKCADNYGNGVLMALRRILLQVAA